MDSRRVRLGSDIDDYCPRCRLIMNHGVVGMVGEDVKKVRCNTCMSEHVFRHGQLPARRKSAAKKLFDEVLKGMKPSEPEEEQSSPPEPARPQRRLYTIRRATGGKTPPRGPRRS
jgi:hypothetical protein